MRSEKLQALLETARSELNLLFEIGNALRTTLDFDETLFIILTGVTAREGLGFNRAGIFLVNEPMKRLEGRLGIGPQTSVEAQKLWTKIQKNNLGFQDLIARYRDHQPLESSTFHRTITSLKVPLTERAGGIIAMSALEGMPMELTRPEARKQAAKDPVLRALKSTSCVLVPLTSREGKVVGVIFADNRITEEPITRESFRMLALLAAHAGLAIENARLYETVLQQADLDPLTGLWNRGAFERFLHQATSEAKKTSRPLSLLLLDMDHFKEYNDRVGHVDGDSALKLVSKLLKDTARAEDHVSRYGGEEFVIILPNTSKVNALKLAERIRLTLDKTSLSLTLSAGVATLPQDAKEAQLLLKAADKALYEAKRLGRNRVVLA